MIERNATLSQDRYGHWYLQMEDPELGIMAQRYNGQVSVRIGRPMETGTEQQNRTAHALMQAFFLSGCHSCPEPCDFEKFKLWLKVQIGPCEEMEYQGRVVRVPKSWARYSKRERMDFIDALLSMVNQSGAVAESPKLQEILKGMEAANDAA